MKLHIFTIVLDGAPYIASHLLVLNSLSIDWHWSICEGAAMNVKDTVWCKPQSPRLSRDGTTEYLNSIRDHPRVTVIQRQKWNGKVEQCNACLADIKSSGVLLQMDADEIWSASQLAILVRFFQSNPSINTAAFSCRFFLGPNIVVTSMNTYSSKPYDWQRAWRFEPEMRFAMHEPPVLIGATKPCASREQTMAHGLVFDHYAYATETQVRFKEAYYGYAGAVAGWRRLQNNKVWPVYLRNYFPWVKDNTIADQLHRL